MEIKEENENIFRDISDITDENVKTIIEKLKLENDENVDPMIEIPQYSQLLQVTGLVRQKDSIDSVINYGKNEIISAKKAKKQIRSQYYRKIQKRME